MSEVTVLIDFEDDRLHANGGIMPAGARFDTSFDDAKEIQNVNPISGLAQYVRECWKTNRDHKKSLDIIMQDCLRQRNGEYSQEEQKKLDEVDIYLNITGLKCDACESWVKDVMINAEDQPWTIEPTPISDISDNEKQQIKNLLKKEILARGYILPEVDQEIVAKLKDASSRFAQKRAVEACQNMTKRIADQMVEGEWKRVFEAWQSDLITYPAGVLKGPIIKHKKSLKWSGDELVVGCDYLLTTERVSPMDLYPSPEATNPQDANNIIERMRMTKSKLYECIGLPNFDEGAIRLVLEEFDDGYYDWSNIDAERDYSERKGNRWADNQTIDVLDFWGRVSGKLLDEWGITGLDLDRQYECNVWLVQDYVIRAVINPDPLGRRPYHVAHFRKLNGQFWGKGIPQLLRDIQRTANSAARSLIRNMSVASGPTVELDVDRLDPSEETPEKIAPWRVYYTKSPSVGQSASPVLRYNVAPSIANELMGILESFLRKADEFSGVPAYTYGSQTGALPTLGGFSLQYGNALKGVKNILSNMDRDGIEPLITQYWTYNMLYDEDESIKADAKVFAKGSYGILQKEQAQARSIETLQVLSPFIQQGLIPKQAGLDIVVNWAGQNGFDISQYFPDKALAQEISDNFSAGNNSAGNTTGVIQHNPQSMQAGTPNPQLDGRQAMAIQVMQNEQLPAS